MVKLIDFFRLIRTKNLLIIAISQYLIRYAIIIPMTDSKSLNDLQFFYLVLSTILIAASGYIINDYFDTRVDRLNNRKLIIDYSIKRREAILLHFLFSGIGVFLGFFLAWKVGIINLGFISCDLIKNHSVTYFLKDTIKFLDKSKFKIYVFSINKRDKNDESQNELRSIASEWFDLQDRTNQEIVEIIQEKNFLHGMAESCSSLHFSQTMGKLLLKGFDRFAETFDAFV